ncbi:MAG TPA: hypothetical protein VN203_16395, partial [Candidatus Acidoferrum sp.]|nr:hypothetical protein [Candidatus Acidoferrum sp.]
MDTRCWQRCHQQRKQIFWWATGLALAFGLATSLTSAASEPKYGGVLNAPLEETPPSLSIHEEATVGAVWPMMPCYNNLVLFDP